MKIRAYIFNSEVSIQEYCEIILVFKWLFHSFMPTITPIVWLSESDCSTQPQQIDVI